MRDQVKTRVEFMADGLQRAEIFQKEMEYKLAGALKQIEINTSVIN